MSDSTSPAAGLSYLEGARPQLVLRYLELRWLRDVGDLLDESGAELRFDDLDMDTDVVELARAAGVEAMRDVALVLLAQRARIPDDDPALVALAPELSGDRARAFLQLVAVNLAFRLRSDELLQALAAHVAAGAAPRLAPARLGALLARARSPRAARALLEASPLEGEARQAALAACQPLPVDLSGTRIHAETDQASLELALERCFPDRRLVAWTDPLPNTRRLLALRQRGGWVTLLEEGEGHPPLELARELARSSGVGRVAWVQAQEDQPPELQVLDGTQTVLSSARLAETLGGPPGAEDVVGELLALGILDLDPEHSRGLVDLRFERYLRKRKKGVKAMAFGRI